MIRAGALHAAWRALPEGRLEGRFLVLAPHPDDESLGCGGLIAQACARGCPPVVAILTDGGFSHPGSVAWDRARLARLRAGEARAAGAALGLDPARIRFLGAPDGACPAAGTPAGDRLADAVLDLARAHGCETLLCASALDPHHDHVAAAGIAAAAAARGGLRHLAYPVWSWTLDPDAMLDAGPPHGIRVAIGDALARKRAAIAAHRSQAGLVVTDDPDGFRLTPDFLALFDTPWEVLVAP